MAWAITLQGMAASNKWQHTLDSPRHPNLRWVVPDTGSSIDAMTAAHNLQRFLVAQDTIYEDVLAELRDGRKSSHWMWFVFPQLEGLGLSPTARFYALSGLDEARAYLAHRVLGPRLRECTQLVNAVQGRSVHEIFGTPDDLKFRSSMTLFARAAADAGSDGHVFQGALDKYFNALPDARTLELLRR